MARLTGPTVLLLMTWCLLFAQDTDTLEVIYTKRTISATRGSSVKLSCQVDYNFKQCDVVHAVWNSVDEHGSSTMLTDPRKYFTTVSETVSDGGTRHRQVVTEILNVTPEDDGQYQCEAKCEGGETSEGHFIQVNVEG